MRSSRRTVLTGLASRQRCTVHGARCSRATSSARGNPRHFQALAQRRCATRAVVLDSTADHFMRFLNFFYQLGSCSVNGLGK